MPQRNVASNFTFEQQRVEINNLAQDFWSQKGTVDTALPTFLKHDGSNKFTGQTLAVPNAFTINSNSGNGTVTIAGNLQVDGTTTTVNTATMDVVDKNITIAKGSANDAAADGAGITIDSATDITFNFVDAKDALVSSIGLEAATFVKATRAQFTGAGNPTTGQGLELTAPDQNTGQIASYSRDANAYKELRLKGSSVSLYTGTTNALIGTFNSTGLTMESGKTITGVLATAAQPNITSLGTLTGLTIENALSTNGRASAHGYICRDNFGAATNIGNGMYSPAVNTLGFATNSVERLTLTGDTSYSSFTLKRSATTNQNAVFYYDANYLDIETREATGIRLKTNQGNSLIIESTGNIINEVSHTGTGAYFKNTNSTDGFGVRVEGGGTTADRYSLAVFNAAGEESFRVNANKKVGIGSAQPTRLLHVEDTDTSNGNDVATFINDDTTNGYGVNITAGGTASNRYSLRVANGASTEVFKVKADGFAELRGAADVRLTLGNAGTAGTNSSNWIRGVNNNLFYNAATSDHLWEIGGAEHMRLNNSGNLYLRSESVNYLVLGNNGDATSNNITNNMNWVRGNAANVQYNTCGGFHAWEISGAEKMQLTSDGYLTNVSQAGFAARMTSNFSHPGNNSFNSGTSWVMPFDDEIWDTGGNFDVSSYTFTAPVAGRYLCCYTIQLETISGWLWNYIYPVVTGTGGTTNTSASTAAGVIFADDGGTGVTGTSTTTAAYRVFTNTLVMNLTAGQQVRMGIRGQMTATIKGASETQWTMQLLA